MAANEALRQVADHTAEVIGALDAKPAVMQMANANLNPFTEAKVTEIKKVPMTEVTRSGSTAAGAEVAEKALAFVKRFV